MTPQLAHVAIWIVWAISWIVAAQWSSPAAKRPHRMREAPYRILMGLGLLILFAGFRSPPLGPQLWSISDSSAWLSVSLPAIGFAFSWWARIHLGALWSAHVTRKDDHRVVGAGPYALVRHPIYTGLLAAALGLVAIGGTAVGVSGFVVLVIGTILKARLEEAFLTAELGAAYGDYRRRVPMLVPGAPA